MPPRRRRRRHATPRPLLLDDVIEKILLRVAPDDPATLVRAAVACRRWCRLVADPSFRRRRIALHGATPPMLGFLCDGSWPDSISKQPYARFVPKSTCRPQPPCADDHNHDRCRLRCFDARHGRVLLHGDLYKDFIVWDPVTGKLLELPSLPWSVGNGSMKATVLCAATGHCDHLDCHRGPFIVVLVGTNDELVSSDVDEDDTDFDNDDDDSDDTVFRNEEWVPKDMFSCIYSSETGSWSEPKYAPHPGDKVDWARSALVGNSLFFALSAYDKILKYDLGTQQMSVIRLPNVRTNMIFTKFVPIELTTLEDGRLGFTRVEESYQLCLRSRDGGDELGWTWTLRNVIHLKNLFPQADKHDLGHSLVGFAESLCVAFLEVQGGLFTIDMKSGLMKQEVYQGLCLCAVPYIDFCTPALRVSSSDDGSSKDLDAAPMGDDGSSKHGDAAPMGTLGARKRKYMDRSTPVHRTKGGSLKCLKR